MAEILQGSCLQVLPTLPSESVNCCITSPPYWGLRDYGTAKWEGGDETCDHMPPDEAGSTTKPTSGQRSHPGRFAGPTCRKCGAVRIDDQLGLEATPQEYVAKMVEVFREVRQVLTDDGTLWLNLGDSYGFQGLKPKDLVGIPWRVAFALQDDGWWLRQDIIWHKPNPMPESVTDRCTKAHEYVFLLSKSQKYYFDSEAIAEKAQNRGEAEDAKLTRRTCDLARDGKLSRFTRGGGSETGFGSHEKRNKRSVWTVNTKPYPKAHFATFPPKLIEPMVQAGCPEGGTVLDPFIGSGTTAEVCERFGRKCIGIELNPDYVDLIHERLKQKRMF